MARGQTTDKRYTIRPYGGKRLSGHVRSETGRKTDNNPARVDGWKTDGNWGLGGGWMESVFQVTQVSSVFFPRGEGDFLSSQGKGERWFLIFWGAFDRT